MSDDSCINLNSSLLFSIDFRTNKKTFFDYFWFWNDNDRYPIKYPYNSKIFSVILKQAVRDFLGFYIVLKISLYNFIYIYLGICEINLITGKVYKKLAIK